tara:strand:- start:103 stop:675 length:573 start_codon:yes stop_codon:yes gene_type:complete
MNCKVTLNNFVLRQNKESGKTYSDLSFDEIAKYATQQLEKDNYINGYREGVLLIPVEPHMNKHFVCPFTAIDEKTTLKAKSVKRRPNEQPYIQIRATSGKLCKTGKVDLILYHNSVLKETDEHTEGAEWELISFHSIPEGVNEMPMGPVTMMRNQLELPGGTKGEYSSKKWAESVDFWQKYAILEPTERG